MVRGGVRRFWNTSLVFPLALIVAAMCSSGSTSSSPPREQRTDRSSGHLCMDDPRCFCVRDDVSWRLCESVQVSQTTYSNISSYQMKCFEDVGEDAYRQFSLMSPLNQTVRSIWLEIEGCPPPNHSYASLLRRRAENDQVQADYYILERLEINCYGLHTFFLDEHHFDGLRNLKHLYISCPSIYNLSEGLFAGISSNVHTILIEGTSIETLPDRFFSGLNLLKTIFLNENRLKRFQGSLLRDATRLNLLNLKMNRIEHLDDDIFMWTPDIETLYISWNKISAIPPSLCCLRGLMQLYAEENLIGFLPPNCLQNLVQLQELRLQGNRLVNLDTSWDELSGVTLDTRLDNGGIHGPFNNTAVRGFGTNGDVSGGNSSGRFSNSRLNVHRRGVQSPDVDSRTESQHAIPEFCERYANESFIFACKQVADSDSILVGDYNGAGLNKCIELRPVWMMNIVDLSRNKISRIHPNSFPQNFKIAFLHLSDNMITDVSEILLLADPRLIVLDLSGNGIRTLESSFFSNVTNLEEIDLSNNRLSSLPGDIFRPFNISLQDDRKIPLVLNLEGNLLEALPELTLPRLTVLKLSRNRLTYFSTNMLGGLPDLKKLDLSHNFISMFQYPNWILGDRSMDIYIRLINLAEIDVSGNRLVNFTVRELHWPSLKALNLSGNRLQESVSRCHSSPHPCEGDMSVLETVTHLDLSRNGLKMPDCQGFVDQKRRVVGCRSFFRDVRNLEVAILSHNEMEYVPMEFLHYLPNLSLADLSHNRIKTIWPSDLLVSSGLTPNDLQYFDLQRDHYVYREDDGGHPFYEYSNAHQLTIDLRHNHIDSVVLPDYQMRVVTQDCRVEEQFARTTFLLGGNPLVCGCNSLKLLQYSLQEIRPTSTLERTRGSRFILPAKVDIEGLRCAQPRSVAGKALSEPETWMHHLLPLLGLCASLNEGHEAADTLPDSGQRGAP